VLIILDGWGIQPNELGNAIQQAHPREMARLWEQCPHTTLDASSDAVGLPNDIMGNSEVGHLNIGAGRVVLQDLVRINKSIADGDFFQNKTLNRFMEEAKKNNKNVHFMGLLSDGGVHSNITHLYALLELAKKLDCQKVWVHPFLDGRDTPPKSAQKYIQALEEKISELSVGKIATLIGRYYSMDRDHRWNRTAKAYYAIALGQGLEGTSAEHALEEAYLRNETDEFVQPTVLKNVDYQGFEDGDVIFFFNFRSDRPRQLVESLYNKDFKEFDRKSFNNTQVICMTEYDKDYKLPTVFQPVCLKNNLGQVISGVGLRQLRIAETEKYAHVTFFFNGGEETPNKGEDRILINSPKVATYDLKPEMSAKEVTDILVEKIRAQIYDFILVNYANPDMVAHTAVLPATIKAISFVDQCLARVLLAIKQVNGLGIITSDHGHAEQLIDYETGGPWTAHTLNPVPFIIATDKKIQLHHGRLGDIAPTVLQLMNLKQPKEMTGCSLIDP
jgi:2,3-bisphosphoglycerate-independent phosphoglycerate mutase